MVSSTASNNVVGVAKKESFGGVTVEEEEEAASLYPVSLRTSVLVASEALKEVKGEVNAFHALENFPRVLHTSGVGMNENEDVEEIQQDNAATSTPCTGRRSVDKNAGERTCNAYLPPFR